MPLNPFNVTITDFSPLFQYSPSQDGPLTSSWNATFSGSSDSSWVPEALGVGDSAHRTTFPGASVRLDWIGTAIYLYGSVSPGGCTLDLDGTVTPCAGAVKSLIIAQTGLTYGSHWLTLRVNDGSNFLTSITGATITVGIGENGTAIQNRTIETISVPPTPSDVALSGTWDSSHVSYGGSSVPRITTDVKGSSLSFTLTSASAFYIIGGVNYNHGPYSVNLTSDLGASQTVNYNGSCRWVGLNAILYLATGLDRNRTYQVQVVDEDNLYYDQSEIIIFDAPPSSTSSEPNPESSSDSNTKSSKFPMGAIIGVAVGCTLLVLVIAAFLFFRLRKRRQISQFNQVNSTANPATFAPFGGPTSTPTNFSTAMASPPPIAQERPYPEIRRPSFIDQSGQPFQPFSIISRLPQPPQNTFIINRPPQLPPTIMASQSERSLPTTSTTMSDVSPSYATPSGLSREEARFFNDLHAHNVPAAEIATMMRTLRAERVATNSDSDGIDRSSGSKDKRAELVTLNADPPQYDFMDKS